MRDPFDPREVENRSKAEADEDRIANLARTLAGGVALVLALAIAILPATAQAQAQARTEQTVLMSTNERARADQEKYGYNDAVIAGDTIYLSGIVAGQAPGERDFTPAFERVFKQIGAILKRAGAGYDDIVDVTSFHTDVTAQIEALSQVQKKYLKSPPPAWTAIDVDRLLPDGGIAEIKVVARRPTAPAANTAR